MLNLSPDATQQCNIWKKSTDLDTFLVLGQVPKWQTKGCFQMFQICNSALEALYYGTLDAWRTLDMAMMHQHTVHWMLCVTQ
jgi:hypothetical protein